MRRALGRAVLCALAAGLACGVGAPDALAQDMEPRRWTHLPIGTTIAGLGVLYTTGEVHFDPVLEIENAEIDLVTVAAAFHAYFALAGMTARIDLLVPYQTGRWEGLLQNVPASVQRDGVSDPRLRLSVGVLGSPALDEEAFLAYRKSQRTHTLVGAGVAVRVPLGEYMDDRLINLGQKRFSLEPQLGMVHSNGPWSFEITGSAFLYTDNDDFFGGNQLEQDPLYTVQLHAVRSFESGWWVSAGSAYGWAGSTAVDGVPKDDARSNLLYGASFGFPLPWSHAIRAGYLRQDALEDVGSDVHTFLLQWTAVF